MRVDDPLCDRQADPEAVRLGRHEGSEQRVHDFRRQAGSRVADRDFDGGGRDRASIVIRRLAGGVVGQRVHGVPQQIDEHLHQEHRIAVDDARSRRQIEGRLDLPLPHVVGNEGEALVDDRAEVDRRLLH